MQQPANFDSVILDGLLADWLLALSDEAVEVIAVLGPDVFGQRHERQVRAVHPPRMLDMAQALANSNEFGAEWQALDLPMAVWQDISRGPYNELARWRVLALSHGLQSMVRVAFALPRGLAFECYALTPRAFSSKSEAMSLVWSLMNMWPKIKPVIADLTCPLSPREKECLALAFDGLTAVETAQALKCGERTVNYHIANAMRKLRVENKLAAVERACWFGVI
jgi:LuxR family transcriptional regulator, quorum-sensing system regulator SolR